MIDWEGKGEIESQQGSARREKLAAASSYL